MFGVVNNLQQLHWTDKTRLMNENWKKSEIILWRRILISKRIEPHCNAIQHLLLDPYCHSDSANVACNVLCYENPTKFCHSKHSAYFPVTFIAHYINRIYSNTGMLPQPLVQQNILLQELQP